MPDLTEEDENSSEPRRHRERKHFAFTVLKDEKPKNAKLNPFQANCIKI